VGNNIFGLYKTILGAAGVLLVKSDTPKAPWTLLFVPERILASGYYWDYSQDEMHTATLTYP
jgi:hypothetical protein